MHDYISLRIDISPADETAVDLMSAFLADVGYETFEPDEQGLTAYIRKDMFSREAVDDILKDFPMPVTSKMTINEIPGEDWNKEWEKNYYQPQFISGKCLIRSSFHETNLTPDYEIIIDPKMAFGTGHHQTTSSIISLMLETDFRCKKIIDIGTGTGILAILAKKMGAEEVFGIEIDEFAFENAVENGNINKVSVNWICGDAKELRDLPECDFLIANINRNVIVSDLALYSAKIKDRGEMMLSGFYKNDIKIIMEEAKHQGFELFETRSQDDWVALRLRRKLNR